MKDSSALAVVTQWIERWPGNQRVVGLGHMPGLSAMSPVGGVHKRQPHIDIFLSLSLPSPLSKNK